MTKRIASGPVRKRSPLRADADGELTEAPPWLSLAWILLLVLVALEAVEEAGWIGGTGSPSPSWIQGAVLGAAAALVFARAAFEPVARRAWLAFGGAMALWWLGTVAWSAVYGGEARPPYPTFADALWLAWYPLMAAGMVVLIRVRFRTFEVQRWMDGVAVMLIVLVAGFGLVVQPLADHSTHGWLATVVDFSYPVLDVLLIGALLGVYGLLGWRPDAMWIFIGLGIVASTCADAAFAVAQARGVAEDGHYDFVWSLGAVCIAYAAWVREPTVHDDRVRVTGMRAIALALIAQALAIGIQILAIFEEIGKSERVVTALVLVVASVQIVLTRPRAGSPPDAARIAAGGDTNHAQDQASRDVRGPAPGGGPD
jgi:hypothetical protein